VCLRKPNARETRKIARGFGSKSNILIIHDIFNTLIINDSYLCRLFREVSAHGAPIEPDVKEKKNARQGQSLSASTLDLQWRISQCLEAIDRNSRGVRLPCSASALLANEWYIPNSLASTTPEGAR